MDLDDYLAHAQELEASDLFIRANAVPALRVHGRIRNTEFPMLDAKESRRLAYSKMSGRQIEEFERHHEMDLAFTLAGVSRIRSSIYMQRNSVASANRLIPLG